MSEAKKPKKKRKEPKNRIVELDGKKVRLDQMDAETAIRLVEKMGVRVPEKPFMTFYKEFTGRTVRELTETKEFKEVYSQFYEFDEYEMDIVIGETPDEIESYDNETQFKELVKCAESFAYFCHKYVRILHPIAGLIPLVMYRYQRRTTSEYEKYRFNILSKFRQGGLTTTAVAWALWRCMFRKDQQILVMSKTDREAMKAGNVATIALEKFPEWIRNSIANLKEDSKHEKVFQETDSHLSFYTPEAARGMAITILIVDEAAFIKGMDDHWKSMYPTLSTGGSAIIVSTVNGIGNWYEETYHRGETGDNEFHVIDMDYWEHPDYCTPEWVRTEFANLGDKGWAQEILRSFLGSGETYIPSTIIGEMAKYADRHKPLRVQLKEWKNPGERKMGWDEGALWIWKAPQEGHEYIISCDCADGAGEMGDNSCIEVLDVGTLEQVAEFYSNSIPPHAFAAVIFNVATYYNVGTVVVETNGVGAAVAKSLQMTWAYENMYYDTTKSKRPGAPGIKATPQTRHLCVEAFQHRVVAGTVRIFSRRIVKELETFMYNPTTRKPEAQKRKHDDAILALSMALFVRDTFMNDLPVGAEVPEEMTQVFDTQMFKEIQAEIMREGKSEWIPDDPPAPFVLPFVNEDDDRGNYIRIKRPNDMLLREFGWTILLAISLMGYIYV